MQNVVLSVVLLFLCVITRAQDSIPITLTIPAIEISEKSYVQTLSLYADETIKTSATLGDVLAETSTAFVKDYGLNQLQSIQFRGLPASHNSVYWNGVEVDNPFLRQIDLALLGIDQTDDVQLDASGINNFLQSGAALELDNGFYKTQGFRLNGSLGSFNRISLKGSGQFKLNESQHRISLSRKTADNDFIIRPLNGDPYAQDNAGLNAWSIKSRHVLEYKNADLEVNQLFNRVHREIAPIIGQRTGDAEEYDRQYWLTAKYQRRNTRYPWDIQVSLLNDVINFNQPSADVAATSESVRIPLNVQLKLLNVESHQSTISWRSEYFDLRTNNFAQDLKDHRHTLRVQYNWVNSIWQAGAVIEQALHHRGAYFTNYNTHITYTPGSYLNIRVDYGRVMTLPSYNDLFWAEGGNPDILPERSQKFQLAIQSKFKLNALKVHMRVNPYYYDVDNWILWLPGLPFWSPTNVQAVKSRGVDFNLNLSASEGWSATINYAYNRVTNEREIFSGDQSLGKQLIYSPLHSANVSLAYRYRGWQVRPSLRYFSPLFTTRDNSRSLDAQLIGAFYIEKELNRHFTIAVNLRNVTNRNYQVIAGRAQPPRYGDIMLKLNF